LEKEKHIGMVVRCLNNKIGRAVSQLNACEFGDATTPVQGWVIRYLYANRDKDVFQKDLEIRFSVRRSTMTSILQLMEKNGLIVKEEVNSDKRLKKLILTPMAVEKQERMRRCIDDLELRLRQNLSNEEIAAFMLTAEKMGANLDCFSKEEK
jgi:DNA-binding MarR family transcriptional regulator